MKEIVPGELWTDAQRMRFLGTPIGRRCAVVRRGDGGLVVFSPLQATSAAVAELRSLGPVAAFVLPSRFHDRYFDGYFSHFQGALFLARPAIIRDHPDWPLSELDRNAGALADFDYLELDGMPRMRETVFNHLPTRTLIVADSLFNVPPASGWLDNLLLRCAGIGNGPTVCRLFRAMVRDRKALAATARQVLDWEFDRIIPGHGEVIESGGRDILRRAFARYVG